MLELIKEPWPWYISGTLIAAIMVLLNFYGKKFGFSSNLRIICAACGAGKYSSFFNYNWREQKWSLLFLLGAVIGGWISSTFLTSDVPLALSKSTINDLKSLGINFDGELSPLQLFNMEFLMSVKGLILFILGGFLVGFGTRYANGCTSGHAISGLSNLQLPSLIAVIGFFIGGLITTYLLYPLIF
ncbi:MAG: YeeE/YedE family protein [Chitinophagaceae bacterium]|nr:YeeE/YedE family protein [Chitinophagaceae bacterium]